MSGSPFSARESRSLRKLPTVKLPDLNTRKPSEFWHAYFKKQKLNSWQISNVVDQLHKAGKHEHVVAAIEAALLNGQSQPWMYDVLALSMQITGRSKEDIERVLLSRVDFTAADVPNMIYSAAYLTRFGRYKQALHLYQQASKLEPTRPEPYVLGLKLARRENDFDAIGWAASGILTHAWACDHKQLHRLAEDAALEAEKKLLKQELVEQADVLKQVMAEARKRDLFLKLTWVGDGDLDLVVEEPLGTICSFQNPQSRGGGVLIRDGYGPDPKNCCEEYICAFGVPGTYRAKIRHVAGNIVGKRARLKIIRYQGTKDELVHSNTITLSKKDSVVRIFLNKGRRKKLTESPKQKISPNARRTMRSNQLQMLGQIDAGSRKAARDFFSSRSQNLTQSTGKGFQPIVTTLSENMTLSVLAIISADRRYVRISAFPKFTNITDVFTFNPVIFGNGRGVSATAGTP